MGNNHGWSSCYMSRMTPTGLHLQHTTYEQWHHEIRDLLLAMDESLQLRTAASWHHGIMNKQLQYIPRNMHTVFALLCFVVVIHWLIFPYPSGLLHWHWGNLTIAPVPAKQPWWIWINTYVNSLWTIAKPQQSKAQQNRVHISWDILYTN